MTAADDFLKYPPSKPNKDGLLEVSKAPRHAIYWQEHGNPKGEPVIVLHGGPGIGCSESLAQFFDPKHYRIILFDQRGSGKSEFDDLLKGNTTQELVKDIDKLRDELGIKGKAHIFGGSWGSTLALAYAIEHPDKVKSLMLRGVFLGRKKDLDFFQADAADLGNPKLQGAGRFFPEDWKPFVDFVPPNERHDMLAYYDRMLNSNEMIAVDGKQVPVCEEAARRWNQWSAATEKLHRTEADIREYDTITQDAINQPRIEARYCMNGCFFNGNNRDQNYIIEHVDKIKNIPTEIVQGRYDMICPRFEADDLIAAWNAAQPDETKRPKLHVTEAGHVSMDPPNARKLTEVTDRFRLLGKDKQASIA